MRQIADIKNQIRKTKRQERWDDVADLEFRLQDKRFSCALVASNLKRDVEYQAALRVRQRWVHRFTKWAALQCLLGGSVDYTHLTSFKRSFFVLQASRVSSHAISRRRSLPLSFTLP